MLFLLTLAVRAQRCIRGLTLPPQFGSLRELYPQGRDALFNCLGTTRATAGGAKGFKDVEVGCTEAAAKVAKEAGVPHVLVVSAMGANANAWVDPWEMVHPLLYARTLGQKEKVRALHAQWQEQGMGS